MRMGLPFIAQAANGFAEAHGQIDDGLQPLRIDGCEPLGMTEKEFSVP